MEIGCRIPAKLLYLDIETTGGHPPRDTIWEVGIVDDDGRTVLNTLVDPQRPLGNAEKYHGITESMLAGAPTLRELWPTVEALVFGCHIVAFNAAHDRNYFPARLTAAGHISCAMERFAPIYGRWSGHHGNYTFQSLKTAVSYIGYQWEGVPHRALTDALACHALWRWMEDRDAFNEGGLAAGHPRLQVTQRTT